MKLKELRDTNFTNLRVCVSRAFNQGYDWEDILNAPDYEVDWIWESDVKYFTKTKLYDLVIYIGV